MQSVTIYALSTCHHCGKAKELLESLIGADGFTCHYVDRLSGDARNDIMRELRRANPSLSFPTVVIGDTVIIGNKDEEIKAALAAS